MLVFIGALAVCPIAISCCEVMFFLCHAMAVCLTDSLCAPSRSMSVLPPVRTDDLFEDAAELDVK